MEKHIANSSRLTIYVDDEATLKIFRLLEVRECKRLLSDLIADYQIGLGWVAGNYDTEDL